MTWMALLLTLVATLAPALPAPEQRVASQFFSCTQPFMPEMYVDQYATGTDPADVTLNVFGVATMGENGPIKGVPLFWVYFKPGPEGEPTHVIVTMPEKPVVQLTTEDFLVQYGRSPCDVYMQLPRGA